MRAIGGVVIAIAVIFGTMSLASAADYTIPLIKDTRGLESKTNYADVNIVYEIVLITHPCDPLSNSLFAPDDPIVQCAVELDEELEEYIEEISIEAIGFPINIDDLEFPEVTNLNDLEQQIIQLDTTSELIFEHEVEDLTKTISEEQIIEQYQNIKDKWKKEVNELKNNANALFKENPGMKSKIIQQDIEKLKIKFDLKEEKIKNTAQVQKKIKTAIELKSLKKEFQDSMTEYVIAEKIMKYGDEKDKKLEQLSKQNMKLMKKMLIAESKHNDKKLELDDFKKIDEKVAQEIKNSVGENAGQTDNDDSISGSASEPGNSGKGSDKSKGSDNKGKSSNGKGKGKSKK